MTTQPPSAAADEHYADAERILAALPLSNGEPTVSGTRLACKSLRRGELRHRGLMVTHSTRLDE